MEALDITSNSSCSSPDYFEYLNSMVLRSNMEIKKERRLLAETCYPTKNFDIVAGISIARGLIPTVKIVNKLFNLPNELMTISFDDTDWFEFLNITSSFILVPDNEKMEKTVQALSENFTVKASKFLEEWIITVMCLDVPFCFTMEDIRLILNQKFIVNYRLELLVKLGLRPFSFTLY